VENDATYPEYGQDGDRFVQFVFVQLADDYPMRLFGKD
jgi:hypothetical protein